MVLIPSEFKQKCTDSKCYWLINKFNCWPDEKRIKHSHKHQHNNVKIHFYDRISLHYLPSRLDNIFSILALTLQLPKLQWLKSRYEKHHQTEYRWMDKTKSYRTLTEKINSLISHVVRWQNGKFSYLLELKNSQPLTRNLFW